MVDYQILYTYLFNVITDTIGYLDEGSAENARETLILAQQRADEMYIEMSE